MAVSFKLRTQKSVGNAPLFARIQAPKLNVNLLLCTHIEVDIEKWNYAHTSSDFKDYIKTPEGKRVKELTAEIKKSIDSLLRQDIKLTTVMAEKLMDDIVYREERLVAQKKHNYITLNQYINDFIKDAESGRRQTEKGTNYAKSTVRSIKQAMTQWAQFQEATGRTYDFDDIDMQCYYDYTAYLKGKNYAINSVGKCIKELKGILAAAESEGHHTNSKYKDKKFKGTRVEVDSVFLTKEELTAMMNADLSDLGPGYEIARDIFMVGVWTAQRVSDYNNISKKDINTYTRKYIVEEEDPNTKEKIEKVVREEVTYKTAEDRYQGGDSLLH